MRVVVVFAAALLLTGCTWIRQELEPAPSAAVAPAATPTPKPDVVKPHKTRVEKPTAPVETATPVAAPPPVAAAPPPPPDYNTRCHEMADNRALDAKQLGASAADQAKIQGDTYRDCMAQTVK